MFQIVKRLKAASGEESRRAIVVNRDNVNFVEGEQMQRIKFKYCRETYCEYSDKLGKLALRYNANSDSDDEKSFAYFQRAVFKMCRMIYSDHIDAGANQINLSAETRQELMQLFHGDADESRFESFEDFMYVFDTALIEIYTLIIGIYNYRFKKWLQEN